MDIIYKNVPLETLQSGREDTHVYNEEILLRVSGKKVNVSAEYRVGEDGRLDGGIVGAEA